MAKITRALISVSDKTGVVEFSRELASYGVEILSTGGTAKLLREDRQPTQQHLADVSERERHQNFPSLDSKCVGLSSVSPPPFTHSATQRMTCAAGTDGGPNSA